MRFIRTYNRIREKAATRKQEIDMQASDLLVRCLEREGIEYVFGVPGEENADLVVAACVGPAGVDDAAAHIMFDEFARLSARC